MHVSSKKKVELFIHQTDWLQWKKAASGSLAGFIKKEIGRIVSKKLKNKHLTDDLTAGESPVFVRFAVPKGLSKFYEDAVNKSGVNARNFWLEKLIQPQKSFKETEDRTVINGVINQLKFLIDENKSNKDVCDLANEMIEDLEGII